MRLQFLFYIFLMTIPIGLYSQESNYIITGTVVNGSTNNILSGANIISSNGIGTTSNDLGEFSITVNMNDTLKISYVGFKTISYVCPEKEHGVYLIKFKLYTDSVSLREVEIFPYPTYKEFKEAFLALDKQDEKVDIKGVKTYQDKITHQAPPSVFSPISFVYDRLFDKKARTKRKIKRRKSTIREGVQVKDDN